MVQTDPAYSMENTILLIQYLNLLVVFGYHHLHTLYVEMLNMKEKTEITYIVIWVLAIVTLSLL